MPDLPDDGDTVPIVISAGGNAMLRLSNITGAAILIMATVVSACAPTTTTPSPSVSASASGPKKGGTLILARQGEVTNLDPHKVPAFTSARVFELVYSYLMRLDENLAVQPDLADSMPTTSSDGKTVTVKIRSGVKFHNGDALTSADVKYTFDRIIDTKTVAVARSFFGDVDTITAPDATTVVFNLKTANAALIAYMAHPNTGIVSKKIGEANADLSKKETAIGSGPFKLVEWVPDNYMRFEANKDYYVSGQPYLDGIRINVVPDETAITAALRTKAADMAIIFDAKVARTLRSEAGVVLSAKPSLGYNLLFVNTKRKPFDNLKVRQAIAYAIDRKAIIDAVAFGEGEVTGPVAPALTNYALPTSQYPLYTRDVAKAKALLQEAAVGPVSFTMLTQTTEPVYAKDIAQLVQAQLAEIGVTMKIETLEFTQWVERWLKADFDMAPGLNGGGPDPDFYVFRYFTDDGNLNFVTSYKNPISSDAIKAARATADVAKRKELYTTAQKELVNGVPFIWLYVGRDYNATLPTTKGFIHLPTGSVIYLRQTWLDK
jgi:peptide/nickel transport system substrate-binding protein